MTTQINVDLIPDAAVTGAKLASGAVDSGQVAAGAVVQVVNTQVGTGATGTTQIPNDNSVPQSNEGDQYMTLAITPKSATNKLKIEVVAFLSNSAAAYHMCAALFQDATAAALACGFASVGAATYGVCIKFTHYMTAGTAGPTTFKVRAGIGAAGTTSFNGQAGTQVYGGVCASSITITEIKA